MEVNWTKRLGDKELADARAFWQSKLDENQSGNETWRRMVAELEHRMETVDENISMARAQALIASYESARNVMDWNDVHANEYRRLIGEADAELALRGLSV